MIQSCSSLFLKSISTLSSVVALATVACTFTDQAFAMDDELVMASRRAPAAIMTQANQMDQAVKSFLRTVNFQAPSLRQDIDEFSQRLANTYASSQSASASRDTFSESVEALGSAQGGPSEPTLEDYQNDHKTNYTPALEELVAKTFRGKDTPEAFTSFMRTAGLSKAITKFSEQIKDLNETDASDLVQKHLQLVKCYKALSFVHPDDRAAFIDAARALYSGGADDVYFATLLARLFKAERETGFAFFSDGNFTNEAITSKALAFLGVRAKVYWTTDKTEDFRDFYEDFLASQREEQAKLQSKTDDERHQARAFRATKARGEEYGYHLAMSDIRGAGQELERVRIQKNEARVIGMKKAFVSLADGIKTTTARLQDFSRQEQAREIAALGEGAESALGSLASTLTRAIEMMEQVTTSVAPEAEDHTLSLLTLLEQTQQRAREEQLLRDDAAEAASADTPAAQRTGLLGLGWLWF